MKDPPTVHWLWVAMAFGSGSLAPAAKAAQAAAAFTKGGFTGETSKSPRDTVTTPSGRWKFSSKVTEFWAAPQIASAPWSASRRATPSASRFGRQGLPAAWGRAGRGAVRDRRGLGFTAAPAAERR